MLVAAIKITVGEHSASSLLSFPSGCLSFRIRTQLRVATERAHCTALCPLADNALDSARLSTVTCELVFTSRRGACVRVVKSGEGFNWCTLRLPPEPWCLRCSNSEWELVTTPNVVKDHKIDLKSVFLKTKLLPQRFFTYMIVVSALTS